MKLSVNKIQRKAKMRAHTATHLLHAEINKIFSTKQMGSLVDEDLVRFDFASDKLITEDEIKNIEININSIIKSDCEVNTTEMKIDEAKKLGAKAFFEDKYGDVVRVVSIGSEQTKYFIFDFDGVIADSLEASINGHIGVFEAKSKAEARDRVLNYANTKPFHTKDVNLTTEQEAKHLESMKIFGEHMSKLEIKLFDEFIKQIIQIPNTKLAIVSSGMKSYILPTLGEYSKYFDYIYDYEDSRSKEDKVELVCKNGGLNKSDIYYFTDTLADIYEFRKFLDKKQIIGCAWGFSGLEKLQTELSSNQIILDPKEVTNFINNYTNSNQLLSIELCGGTHVNSTSQIGAFKIISQQAVASGTKRIIAYTGPKVLEYIYEQDDLLNTIGEKLSCEPKQAPEKVEKISKDLAAANSQIESFKSGAIANISWKQVDKSNYTSNIYILNNINSLTIKDISNYLKGKDGNYIYSDSMGSFAIYSSSKQAKIIQADLGIKGGGNDQMIQGKDENILEKLK